MVLLRRVEVRASGAHGRGVFALERIARGECWWRFDEESCDAYTHDEAWARATSLEAAAQGGDGEAAEALRDMCWFGYYAPTARAWVVAQDGAQFVNHCGDDASRANSGGQPAGVSFERVCDEACYATRDIEAGEEILEDYGTYGHGEWEAAFLRRFCPERADFEDTVEKKDALVQIDAGAPAEEA